MMTLGPDLTGRTHRAWRELAFRSISGEGCLFSTAVFSLLAGVFRLAERPGESGENVVTASHGNFSPGVRTPVAGGLSTLSHRHSRNVQVQYL
jgi:hypothetical protein